MSVVWGIEMDPNLHQLLTTAQRWGDPVIVTRDWYAHGWAVHARQSVGEREVAVVSVNFSVPREDAVRGPVRRATGIATADYPVKVKASPKTCELEVA